MTCRKSFKKRDFDEYDVIWQESDEEGDAGEDAGDESQDEDTRPGNDRSEEGPLSKKRKRTDPESALFKA
jgi:hypothetical protein